MIVHQLSIFDWSLQSEAPGSTRERPAPHSPLFL